jgi:N-acetylglucosamine-6-phosphate deacetylase
MPLHITHLYNVSSFHHRKQSLCNFGLSSRFPNLPDYKNIQTPTVELIGDTVHVHPLTLQLTIDYKSNDIALISDAIMDVHSKGVDYNNRQVEVCRNNHTNYAVLKGTSTIAGSCTNSLQIFHNIVRYINTPVEKAIMMLTENPARIANLTHLGTLEVGKRGDVLIFDNNYELQTTIIAGKVAWKRNK